ncbi:Na-translocating system protein MpsC family protein [Frigoriglobus tundricola]|uniref:Na-translocating system protein MpsC family protein n=1 Tax=Frigoriglobus tundricola TaxID=2774151 RepID=UPI00148EA38C|nr:Na-translocating system protein MpsC family protein [Frigoriglobus tundricola]
MDRSRETIGKTIARAVRAFETRRTKHGRKWVTVFLNEDTVVIALHGSLTAAEKALVRSPAGTDRVREHHRQLFTDASAPLRRTLKGITGMGVRDTTAEIEPSTNSVVQFFTTDTAGTDFPSVLATPPGSVPGRARSAAAKVAPAVRPRQPDVSSGDDRPIRTTRNSQ